MADEMIGLDDPPASWGLDDPPTGSLPLSDPILSAGLNYEPPWHGPEFPWLRRAGYGLQNSLIDTYNNLRPLAEHVGLLPEQTLPGSGGTIGVENPVPTISPPPDDLAPWQRTTADIAGGLAGQLPAYMAGGELTAGMKTIPMAGRFLAPMAGFAAGGALASEQGREPGQIAENAAMGIAGPVAGSAARALPISNPPVVNAIERGLSGAGFAGIQAGADALRGKPFDPVQTGIAAGLGAILHSPEAPERPAAAKQVDNGAREPLPRIDEAPTVPVKTIEGEVIGNGTEKLGQETPGIAAETKQPQGHGDHGQTEEGQVAAATGAEGEKPEAPAAPLKTEENANAAAQGQQPQSSQPEHPNGNLSGEIAEAGGGNRAEQGGQVEAEKVAEAPEVAGVPVVEYPLHKLKLSADVPNFKEEADPHSGIISELPGEKYERLGTGPIVVWERKNGDAEVITGRHRFRKAQSTGEKTIPSQVVREADGFTKQQALTLDAEQNIREGQGSVKDYANYFKNVAATEEQLRQRGVLGRAKADTGYALGRQASDNLWEHYSSGSVPEDRSAAIAAGAPGNERVQNMAISQFQHDKALSAEELRAYAEYRSHHPIGKHVQKDLLGEVEDTEGKSIAQAAANKRKEIEEAIRVARAGLRIEKKGEAASQVGVQVRTKGRETQDKMRELEGERDRWKKYYLIPEVGAEARRLAGLSGEPGGFAGELFENPAPPKQSEDIFGADLEATHEQPTSDIPKSAGAGSIPDEPQTAQAAVSNKRAGGREPKPPVQKPVKKAKQPDRQEQQASADATEPRESGADGGEVAKADEVDGEGIHASATAQVTTRVRVRQGTPPDKVKSLLDVARNIGKVVSTPIGYGRATSGGGQTRFGGFFKPRQNLIQTKHGGDFVTVAHEAGHRIDDLFDIHKEKSLHPELDKLGDNRTANSLSSWTKSKSKKYKMQEGVAEFARYWLTDPDHAKAEAPATYKHFEQMLNDNPDIGAGMRQAQADVTDYRESDAVARFDANVKKYPAFKTKFSFDRLIMRWIDDLHPIRTMRDSMKAGPLPSSDPYILMRNFRHVEGQIGEFLQHGQSKFNEVGTVTGPSLTKILEPVGKNLDEFRRYIVALRAKELHSRGKATPFDPADVRSIIKKYQSPEFDKTFEELKGWSDSLIQYGEDAGLYSHKVAEKIREMNKDYVPFQRVFETRAGELPEESGGNGRGMHAVGKPVKSIKGSLRDVVDPFSSYIGNAYSIITAAEKQRAMRAFVDAADKPNMGKFIERVAGDTKVARMSVRELKDQLEKLGADLAEVPEDALDSMLTVFRPSGQTPYGENIIRFNRAGKAEFYRLQPDVYASVTSLDSQRGHMMLKLLSSLAQVKRAGVVLNPDYMVRNILRDTVDSRVISKHFGLPGASVARTIYQLIYNRDGLKDDIHKLNAYGGAFSFEANYFDKGAREKLIRDRITKDFTPWQRAWIHANPLRWLREASALSEMVGSRLYEANKSYKAALAKGMSEQDARILAAFESADLIDFAKQGAWTRGYTQYVPFMGARIQGNVRMVEAFWKRPLSTSVKAFAFVTAPTIALYLRNRNDPEYWDQPQWVRDCFWLIPTPKGFIPIPRPFELGTIFATVPERLLAHYDKHDPEAFKNFVSRMTENMMPSLVPPIATAAAETAAGPLGWDFFRQKTIAPSNTEKLPAKERYSPDSTSLMARYVGQTFNVSPAKVDHAVYQIGGPLAALGASQVIDPVISGVTGEKRTKVGSYPFSSFIPKPQAWQSEDVSKFYDRLRELNERAAESKLKDEPFDDEEDLRDMNRAAEYMSQLRKDLKGATDDGAKTAIRQEIRDVARGIESPPEPKHKPGTLRRTAIRRRQPAAPLH